MILRKHTRIKIIQAIFTPYLTMKTLKIIMLLFVVAKGSNVQAQTKKETLDWLKEKLEKYGEVDCHGTFQKVTSTYIDACKLVFNYTCNNTNKTYTLWVNEIKSITQNGNFEYCYRCFDEYKNEFETSDIPKLEKPKVEKTEIKKTEKPKDIANTKEEEDFPADVEFGDFEDMDEKSLFDALSMYAQNKSPTYSVKILNGEKNIYSRIDKALKHLATFCPNKKEPF